MLFEPVALGICLLELRGESKSFSLGLDHLLSQLHALLELVVESV
jgi:hypothetical protein